jgi:hypothetical protein
MAAKASTLNCFFCLIVYLANNTLTMVTRQPGHKSYAVLHIGGLFENVIENPEESFQRIIIQNLIKITAEKQEEENL